MKTILTTILLLFAFVAFGQWHPIEAGKGVIITEKDGLLSISMDTTKPCDRCPKFSLDTFVPTFDTVFVAEWDLIERHPLPCPVVETTDSFGRKTYDVQLVYRYTTTYVPQRKEFWNKEDAIRFVELAKREIDLANVRLGVYLKIRPEFELKN